MSDRARFAASSRQPFLVALIGLPTLLATALGWSRQSAKRDDADANAKLEKVISAFNTAAQNKADRRAFEPILREAQSIRDQYRPSPSSRLAWYYVAMCEERLGHLDRAVRSLEGLIRESDPMMKPLAQLALATLYKNHGDGPRAIEIYKELDKNTKYSKHGNHQPGHR
jgi:tetratricopeptide (TPR) repeat protein